MRATTTGSYTGVGIEVSAQDGRVVVVTPIEGSPAAKAGVHAGDVVLAVNDQPVTADKLDETIGRMRGVTGTQVRLAVGRKGEPEPLVFTLERGEVHVHSVRAEPLPGDFGYVRITQFSDSTPDDLVQALSTLVHRRRSRRSARCAASCSTCVAIRAACSNRPSASPMPSSIPA